MCILASRTARLVVILVLLTGLQRWGSKILAKANKREAENKLRRRIKRVLSLAGLNQVLSPKRMQEVEDHLIDLFKEYSAAPKKSKEEVYNKIEGQIMQTFRT